MLRLHIEKHRKIFLLDRYVDKKFFHDLIRTFVIFWASRTQQLTFYHDILMFNFQTIFKIFKSVQYFQWSLIRTFLHSSDSHIKTISCLNQSFETQSNTKLFDRLRRILSSLKISYAFLAMIANFERFFWSCITIITIILLSRKHSVQLLWIITDLIYLMTLMFTSNHVHFAQWISLQLNLLRSFFILCQYSSIDLLNSS